MALTDDAPGGMDCTDDIIIKARAAPGPLASHCAAEKQH
jgi:hypothetical protein